MRSYAKLLKLLLQTLRRTALFGNAITTGRSGPKPTRSKQAAPRCILGAVVQLGYVFIRRGRGNVSGVPLTYWAMVGAGLVLCSVELWDL